MPAEAGGAAPGKGPEGDSGVAPIFIVGTTQEMFGLVTDKDVTSDVPWKLLSKQKILDDIQFRGVISDFQRFKPQIKDFPGEEIMVVYDSDSKYGDNFYIVTTGERFAEEMTRRDRVLNPVVEEEAVAEQVEPQKVRMGWISLGSDKEIMEERIQNDRPFQMSYVSRDRRYFNRPKESFDDRDALDDFTEFRPFKDPNFETRRRELEIGVQAVPAPSERSSQTIFNRKVPASTQVSEESMVQVLDSHWLFEPDAPEVASDDISEADLVSRKEQNAKRKEFRELISQLAHQVNPMLTGNEVLDLLSDDFALLEDEDVPSLKRGEVVLKEQQSFTHIEYSKNKRLSRVQWHPLLKGVLGVSISSAENFDTRVLSYGFVKPSHLLLWAFSDPIVPKCALEAPADISVFAFHPKSMIVVAGCVNGRLCIWDLANINVPQSKGLVVPFALLSSIENGHFGAVADLVWLPPVESADARTADSQKRSELRPIGSFHQSGDASVACQFVTCGYDSNIMVWDVFVRNASTPAVDEQLFAGQSLLGAGNLNLGVMSGLTQSSRKKAEDESDLVWNPTFRVSLTPIERSGRFTSLCLHLDILSSTDATNPSGTTTSSSSSKKTAVLSPAEVFCKTWVGTEEGELGHVNWALSNQAIPQIAAVDDGTSTSTPSVVSSKKNRKDCVDRVLRTHSGPVVGVSSSPFDEHLLLTVGDWKWCLYYMESLIFTSPASSSLLSAAAFSPNRPGVIFTATVDGRIEVWDLLDRTHEPMLSQVVAPAKIYGLSFAPTAANAQHSSRGSLLAVADETGTLRIIEIPRPFSKKILKEEEVFRGFIDREYQRAQFVRVRSDIRAVEYEKMQKEKGNTEQPGSTEAPSQNQQAVPEDPVIKALDEGYKTLEEEFLQMIKGTDSQETVKKP
eukprot:ANDGO_07735.mRNA.1 flagellar outer arm